VDPFDAVGVGVAEQRGLPTTERVVGHRDGDRDVDADHPDLDVLLELAGHAAVAGEHRDPVAVRVGVDQVDRLPVRVDPHHAQHRPEDLLGVDAHVRGHPVEQGGAEPEALGPVLHLEAASVDDEVGAGLHAGIHKGLHLVAVGPGDQWAHVAAERSVSDPELGHPLGDPADDLVADRSDGDQDADRHAPLAGRPEPGVDRRVGHQVEVGVRQDEHVVLRPAEGLHPLAVGRRPLVDVPGDRRRADEADRRDLRRVEERVDGDLVTL
jgi:hypothetical protein